jgi:hypothetical protein
MRFGEHVSTFCGVLFQQTKSKTSPPILCSIFRVLDFQTLKIEIGGARKKKGGQLGCNIYNCLNNGGGHCNVAYLC